MKPCTAAAPFPFCCTDALQHSSAARPPPRHSSPNAPSVLCYCPQLLGGMKVPLAPSRLGQPSVDPGPLLCEMLRPIPSGVGVLPDSFFCFQAATRVTCKCHPLAAT